MERTRLFLLALAVSAPALATEIQPSVRFPSNSYIGEGWPSYFTDGCYDRGTCRLPPSGEAITGATIGIASEVPGSNCHPSYSGSCVPSVPGDLDCDHLNGPVRVIGPDVFGLDEDRDGLACETE
jgi:hypothetical protein